MSNGYSRRAFLASAAASTPLAFSSLKLFASPLVANPDFKYAFDPKAQKLKTAFIGVGGRGTSLLKEMLSAGQVEIVAISDLIPERLAAAQALCVGMTPKAYPKYEELLADSGVEAVVIATPVDEHKHMAIEAMAANKHIYCEKPLGIDAQQAEAMFAKAKDYPKVFQIGFQWVYNPQFRMAVEAIHEGLIGEPKYIHAIRHGGDLPRQKGKHWLFDRSRSGDIIVEQAVHEMNIMCWGMKGHPTKAMGMGGTNVYVNEPDGRTIMDHYSLSYEFPGAHVSYSHLYYAGGLGASHIHFYGSKGAVSVMDGKIYLPEGQKAPAREVKLTQNDTYNALVSFVEDVRNGRKPDASAEKGLLATKMGALGRAALYENRPVTWEDLDHPERFTVKL